MKVVELGELVKAMEEKFGVSAAMPLWPEAQLLEREAAEEKTSWSVLLKEGGSQKIQVIKVLREATGLGLKNQRYG